MVLKHYDVYLEIESKSTLMTVIADNSIMKILEERFSDLITEVDDCERGQSITHYCVDTWSES
jgi:hypothetical protein